MADEDLKRFEKYLIGEKRKFNNDKISYSIVKDKFIRKPIMIENERLYRVEGSFFVAGVITDNQRIRRAAPILKDYIGKKIPWFLRVAEIKGWKVTQVMQVSTELPLAVKMEQI